MNRILCPTDFSKNADIALDCAISLAKKFNADLDLLNTYNVSVSHYGFFEHLEDKMKQFSLDGLKKAKEYAIKNGMDAEKVHGYAQHGVLADIVSRMNKEFNHDLIIMGTKGSSGVDEFLIGSRAADVVSYTEVPTLVVPEGTKDFNFDKILYAADFKDVKTRNDLNALKQVAKSFNSHIDILRILRKKDEETAFQDFDKTGVKLDQWLQNVEHSFHYELSEQIEEGIENFARKTNTKLVAVLARKHGILGSLFHKSITQKLTFHSTTPLLVMKEK